MFLEDDTIIDPTINMSNYCESWLYFFSFNSNYHLAVNTVLINTKKARFNFLLGVISFDLIKYTLYIVSLPYVIKSAKVRFRACPIVAGQSFLRKTCDKYRRKL